VLGAFVLLGAGLVASSCDRIPLTAPSGTALTLRDLLAGAGGRDARVSSTRAGHIPGTHRVGFDSPADQIVLEHTARSRDGFAAGALLAAGWVVGRRGVFRFEDVLDDVLRKSQGPLFNSQVSST
jgi:4-hydroxy-tetrahydrodipicolinate reductase